jgi:3-oxoacyl-[acyl-carrier protein] reductase
MKPLHGKIALVTGVGRRQGIGYAICKELAQNGADIFYTYWREYDKELKLVGSEIDPEEYAHDLESYGVKVASAEVDLSDAQAPAILFASVMQKLGIPDILINNACVSTAQPFLEIHADLLDAHYAVNMRAPVLLCKEFVKHFKKETGGKIINMTSGQSLGVMAQELPYTITKAGLEMLTLQLSFELREQGITLNAVDPGPTDTGWMTGGLKELIAKESPTGKVSTPEDAAALVLSFIHGDKEAVTGSVVHADR